MGRTCLSIKCVHIPISSRSSRGAGATPPRPLIGWRGRRLTTHADAFGRRLAGTVAGPTNRELWEPVLARRIPLRDVSRPITALTLLALRGGSPGGSSLLSHRDNRHVPVIPAPLKSRLVRCCSRLSAADHRGGAPVPIASAWREAAGGRGLDAETYVGHMVGTEWRCRAFSLRGGASRTCRIRGARCRRKRVCFCLVCLD